MKYIMETRESVPLANLGREAVSEGVYVNVNGDNNSSNCNNGGEKTYKVRRGRIVAKQFLLGGGKGSNRDSSSNNSSSNIQNKPR